MSQKNSSVIGNLSRQQFISFVIVGGGILLMPMHHELQVDAQTVHAVRQNQADSEDDHVYAPKEVTRKAAIKRKPDPQYPEEAVRRGVSGVVVLEVVLLRSGRVGEIKVLRGQPEGITEATVKAARQIEFEPAKKDGKKVSMWVRVEYAFNVK